MKNFNFALILLISNSLVCQFDLPKPEIFKDIVPLEEISIKKNVALYDCEILDEKSAIFDAIINGKTQLRYVYSEYDEKTNIYKSRVLNSKLTPSSFYCGFFKKDNDTYAIRKSEKDNKLSFYFEKLINDEFLRSDIADYTKEVGNMNCMDFKILKLNGVLKFIYISRDKDYNLKLEVASFNLSNLKFVNEESVDLEQTSYYTGSGVLDHIIKEDQLYLSYTSNVSREIKLFILSNDNKISQDIISPKDKYKYILTTKFYKKGKQIYFIFHGIDENISICKNFIISDEIELISEKEFKMDEYFKDFYPNKESIPESLLIKSPKYREVITDSLGNIYFFGYFTSSAVEFMDLEIIKIDANNEIDLCYLYSRSSRIPGKYEAFPKYTFKNNFIAFEEFEDEKRFKNKVFIHGKSNAVERDLIKIRIKIDSSTGIAKREIISN